MPKHKKLTAQLPATPCTPALRAQLESYAEKEGRALADVQREAITLFLHLNDSFSKTPASKHIDLEKGA